MVAPTKRLWKESYDLALRESDKPKLTALVHEVEVMIFLRSQEVSRTADPARHMMLRPHGKTRSGTQSIMPSS
jgi:hypothetical protein